MVRSRRILSFEAFAATVITIQINGGNDRNQTKSGPGDHPKIHCNDTAAFKSMANKGKNFEKMTLEMFGHEIDGDDIPSRYSICKNSIPTQTTTFHFIATTF